MNEKYVKITEKFMINDFFEDPLMVKMKIASLINKNSDAFKYVKEKSSIEQLIQLYFIHYSGKSMECNVKHVNYPILKPLEPVSKYVLPELESLINKNSIDEARALLNNFSIASYDSSWHFGGAHFYLDYLIYNTGYFYYNYSYDKGGSGGSPALYIGRVEELDPEIEGKKHEINVSMELAKKLKGAYKLLFLDESLNFIYAFKWSHDKKSTYLKLIKNFLHSIRELNIIPIGVFYTRAYDIIRSLECVGMKKPLPSIQDKYLFNRILDVGERTQLFKVINPVVRDYGLDIASFYLKLGYSNVVRIEFPYDQKLTSKDIENIHKGVFLQSVLGNGYPYCLIRAHEMAVLSYEDRRDVEGLISYILNLPSEYLYSMKQISKWRSIV